MQNYFNFNLLPFPGINGPNYLPGQVPSFMPNYLTYPDMLLNSISTQFQAETTFRSITSPTWYPSWHPMHGTCSECGQPKSPFIPNFNQFRANGYVLPFQNFQTKPPRASKKLTIKPPPEPAVKEIPQSVKEKCNESTAISDDCKNLSQNNEPKKAIQLIVDTDSKLESPENRMRKLNSMGTTFNPDKFKVRKIASSQIQTNPFLSLDDNLSIDGELEKNPDKPKQEDKEPTSKLLLLDTVEGESHKMAELSDEAQAVVQVFRSLCTSRKTPPTLRVLVLEYREVEGCVPPKCGFPTVEDLLRASGKFSFIQFQGQLCVMAKVTAESAHIVEMMNKQKTKRPKRVNTGYSGMGRGRYVSSFHGAPRPQPRSFSRPMQYVQRPPGVPRQPGVPRYNGSRSYAAPQVNAPPPLKTVNTAHLLRTAAAPPLAPLNIHQVPTTKLSHTAPVFNTQPSYVPPQRQLSTPQSTNLLPSQRTRAVVFAQPAAPAPKPAEIIEPTPARIVKIEQRKPEQQTRPQIVYDVDTFDDDPKTENNNNNNTKQSSNNNYTSNGKTELHTRSSNGNSFNTSKRFIQQRPSVQGRLELARQSSAENNNNNTNKQKIVEVDQKVPQKPKPQPKAMTHLPEWWDDKQLSNVRKLECYCTQKGCAEPKYEFFRVRDGKQMKFQCQVTIDDSTYSTYPEDFHTTEEARILVAERAVEAIKESLSKSVCQVFSGTNDELLMILFQCLKKHSAGIFMSEIPSVVQTEFNFTLPDIYEELIMRNRDGIFRIETNLGKKIVFAIQDAFLPSPAPITTSFVEPPCITLPWSKQTWNLYCTYTTSSNEVWCQLFGDEHKGKCDELYSQLEAQDMFVPAKDLLENKFYIAMAQKYPQRVRLMEMHHEMRKASCFCIDTGEEYLCEYDQLYVCDVEFLKLPAQAVLFSLNGLEMFEGMNEMSTCVQEQLQYKAFVGAIKVSEKDYQYRCGVLADPTIEVIMWDTSSDVDVNVNEEILRLARPNFVEPKFKVNSLDHIIITGISEKGEISCFHTKSRALEMIRQAINEITSRGLKDDSRGFYNLDEQAGNLYLVLDEKRQEWSRAKFGKLVDSNRISMHLVDRATEALINKANIHRLADLHAGLNIYPAQGLRFRLHKIEPINSNTIKLLRGLIKPESEGICKIKAIGPDGISEVRLLIMNDGRQNKAINEIIVEQTKMQQNVIEKPENNEIFARDKEIADYHEVGRLYPALPKLVIPDTGNYMEVKVLQSQTPNLFYVHTTKCAKEFNRMMTDLQRHGRGTGETLKFDEILVGIEYAALRQSDRKWCRVKVLQKMDAQHISVKFIDYVVIDVVSSTNMKHLPKEFRNIPEQALFAKLHGIQPVKGESYTKEAAIRFKELTHDKIFQSMVKGVEETDVKYHGPSLIVTLDMVDSTSLQELSSILIAEGHATHANLKE